MTTGKCPICSKPAIPEAKPFCSKRCKDVDLNRWFTESYRVPGPAVEEEEDEGGKPNGTADED